MDSKFNWKMFVVCILVALSLIMSTISTVLCLIPKNNQQAYTGSSWTMGEGEPAESNGNVDDYYLDTSSGIVYQKQSSGWVAIYTMGNESPEGTTSWKYGNGQPNVRDNPANVGDYYLDTQNYDVYYRNQLGWEKIGNIKGQNGASGQNGNAITTGSGAPTNNAKDGDLYIDTQNWELYERRGGEWRNLGSLQGPKGDDPNDVYMGYDGHIWNGSERTDWYIPNLEYGKDLFDHTLDITGNMSKYYEGKYINLANDRIALMAYYKPNSNLALYSRMNVKEITVYAKEAGQLDISRASVSDVVTARKNGTALEVSKTQTYDVQKGKTTIIFADPMYVATEETIILGGGNTTVSLYYAENIPVDDEMGNFTVLSESGPKSDIISKFGGEYADTLAIDVEVAPYVELPAFDDIYSQSALCGPVTSLSTAGEQWGAFAYYDETIFNGMNITRIGFPCHSVTDLETSYMDLYKMKSATGRDPAKVIEERRAEDFREKNKLTPLYIRDAFYRDGSKIETTEIEDWIFFNVDIQLAEDETLAFCGDGEGMKWAFGSVEACDANGVDARYKMLGFVGNSQYFNGVDNNRLFFEIFYETSWSFDEQINLLKTIEYNASKDGRIAALKEAMQDKQNISILGDSISTYQDYSNEWQTQNRDIKNNNAAAPYYEGNKQQYFLDTQDMYQGKAGNKGQPVDYRQTLGVPNVDQTWWMAAIKDAGLKLCVNNSSSGDLITSPLALTRAGQLHDNTFGNDLNPGQEAEIYPDIVAIYMGINDFNATGNVSATQFGRKYREVVDKIKTTYPGVTVFVFTLIPCTWGTPHWTNGIMQDYYIELERFNKEIRYIASETGGVELVDTYAYCTQRGVTRDTARAYMNDGIHPNRMGMRLMADAFLESLYNCYVTNA